MVTASLDVKSTSIGRSRPDRRRNRLLLLVSAFDHDIAIAAAGVLAGGVTMSMIAIAAGR